MGDAAILLEWRNDPSTRSASHNSDRVSHDEHVRWLSESLKNPNRRLLIAEHDGHPVGTVRADLADGTWELSWTVSPQARGRGIAKQMVSQLASQIADPVRAEVRVGNEASARIAELAGMTLEARIDDVLHYRRPAV